MKRQIFGILIALVLVLSFGFTVPASSSVVLPNVYVDVKPTSCPNPLNVCSKGALPVAILGTDEFDVTTVDPASVRLNLGADVSPLRWAYKDVATPYETDDYCHDLGPDGCLDLVLKFDTLEVVDRLELSAEDDGAQVLLQITGETFEGMPILGEDTILVINKFLDD